MKKMDEIRLIDATLATLKKKGFSAFQVDALKNALETKKEDSILSDLQLDIAVDLGIELFKNREVFRIEENIFGLAYEDEKIDKILSEIDESYQKEIEDVVLEYDKTRLLSIDEFIPLLLASLKQNDYDENRIQKQNQYTFLPHDYIDTIIRIVTNENKWSEIFNRLIRVKNYGIETVGYFEVLLINATKDFVKNREVTYDFYTESVMIEMSDSEKDSILSKYDKETIELVREFARLIVYLPHVDRIINSIESPNEKTNVFMM